MKGNSFIGMVLLNGPPEMILHTLVGEPLQREAVAFQPNAEEVMSMTDGVRPLHTSANPAKVGKRHRFFSFGFGH